MALPEVSGHRGASATHPENTLAAFRAAIDVGADGIELDVALTRDGVAVVLHDDTVDRTTNGHGDVRELTVAELRGLDAGGGELIPTLDEVLALAAGRVEVNIELKAADAVGAVLAAASRHPELRWFASSFHDDALREVRAASDSARIYGMALAAPFDTLRAALAFAEEVGAEGLSVRQSRIDPGDVTRIHAAGLRIWAWTVDDPGRAAELFDLGVDVLCTDDPALILAVRPAAFDSPA